MSREPPRMWSHWRDKYGPEEALEGYFPEILEENRVLATAKAQIEIAKLAIDAEMKRIATEEDPEGVFE